MLLICFSGVIPALHSESNSFLLLCNLFLIVNAAYISLWNIIAYSHGIIVIWTQSWALTSHYVSPTSRGLVWFPSSDGYFSFMEHVFKACFKTFVSIEEPRIPCSHFSLHYCIKCHAVLAGVMCATHWNILVLMIICKHVSNTKCYRKFSNGNPLQHFSFARCIIITIEILILTPCTSEPFNWMGLKFCTYAYIYSYWSYERFVFVILLAPKALLFSFPFLFVSQCSTPSSTVSIQDRFSTSLVDHCFFLSLCSSLTSISFPSNVFVFDMSTMSSSLILNFSMSVPMEFLTPWGISFNLLLGSEAVDRELSTLNFGLYHHNYETAYIHIEQVRILTSLCMTYNDPRTVWYLAKGRI